MNPPPPPAPVLTRENFDRAMEHLYDQPHDPEPRFLVSPSMALPLLKVQHYGNRRAILGYGRDLSPADAQGAYSWVRRWEKKVRRGNRRRRLRRRGIR